MHWSNELDWPQWWCPQLFVFRWCLGRIAQCSASCRQPCRTEWIKNVLGNHFLKRNKLCMIWWVVDTTTTILKNLAGGIVDDGVKAREGCACGICDVAGFRVSFLRKSFHYISAEMDQPEQRLRKWRRQGGESSWWPPGSVSKNWDLHLHFIPLTFDRIQMKTAKSVSWISFLLSVTFWLKCAGWLTDATVTVH